MAPSGGRGRVPDAGARSGPGRRQMLHTLPAGGALGEDGRHPRSASRIRKPNESQKFLERMREEGVLGSGVRGDAGPAAGGELRRGCRQRRPKMPFSPGGAASRAGEKAAATREVVAASAREEEVAVRARKQDVAVRDREELAAWEEAAREEEEETAARQEAGGQEYHHLSDTLDEDDAVEVRTDEDDEANKEHLTERAIHGKGECRRASCG